MPQRLLELSDRSKAKAQRIVSFAKKRKNWYRTRGDMTPPGIDRRYNCQLNSFRCVFSWTLDTRANKVMRHLSISVESEKNFPHPIAVKQIAGMFGFTGSDGDLNEKFPEDWLIHIKKDDPIDDNCIILAQDTGINP